MRDYHEKVFLLIPVYYCKKHDSWFALKTSDTDIAFDEYEIEDRGLLGLLSCECGDEDD